MISKILHKMFYSCLLATELIEKSFHVKLSFLERLRLSVHKKMCKACTLYEKQSGILEQGMLGSRAHEFNPEEIESLKTSILQKLADRKKE